MSHQTSNTDLREQVTAVVTSYTFAEDSLVNELMQLIESSQAAAVHAARVETVNKAIEMARRADDFVGDVKVVRVTHLAQLQGGKSDD